MADEPSESGTSRRERDSAESNGRLDRAKATESLSSRRKFKKETSRIGGLDPSRATLQAETGRTERARGGKSRLEQRGRGDMRSELRRATKYSPLRSRTEPRF